MLTDRSHGFGRFGFEEGATAADTDLAAERRFRLQGGGHYGERNDDSLLAPGEWWDRDLADEVGMHWQTLREGVIKGWVQGRQSNVEKLAESNSDGCLHVNGIRHLFPQQFLDTRDRRAVLGETPRDSACLVDQKVGWPRIDDVTLGCCALVDHHGEGDLLCL